MSALRPLQPDPVTAGLTALPGRAPARPVLAEKGLHVMLLVLTAFAGLGVSGHVATAFWAQNEFSQPEAMITGQSRMLVREGTLYYSLNGYPYTVCAYMPLIYGGHAALQSLGLAPYTAGRLISFVAFLFLTWTVYQILLLYSRDRRCAWLGAALCGCTSPLVMWGTVGQSDIPAAALALGAFYQFSRFWVAGDARMPWAMVLAVAAVFTKQTYLAAPAAITIALWMRHRREAYRFALVTGGAGLGLLALAYFSTGGAFWKNTVQANMNPMAWEKVEQHASYWLVGAAQLALITIAGRKRLLMSPARPILLYTALAFGVLLATGAKIGSDSNYQIESTVLLILTSALALHALGFFELFLTKTKSWVPLLVMPLLIHAVLNVRLEIGTLQGRAWMEQQFRAQTAELNRRLAGSRRVLSADANALFHLDRPIEVEALIYKMLVEARYVDPTRLQADLEKQAFTTVMLYHDLRRPEDLHVEIPTLPPAQLDVVRARYRHTAFVPGPYRGGLHIYEPK